MWIIKNWTYNFLFIWKCNLKIYVTFPCFLLLRLFCDWWNYFFMLNVLEVIGKVGWGQFGFRWTVKIEGLGLENSSKFIVNFLIASLSKFVNIKILFKWKKLLGTPCEGGRGKHIFAGCQLLNANNKTFLSH